MTILHVGPTSVRLSVAASGKPLAVGLPAGTRVATVTVNGGGQVQTVAAVTDQPITGPSRRWRVERLSEASAAQAYLPQEFPQGGIDLLGVAEIGGVGRALDHHELFTTAETGTKGLRRAAGRWRGPGRRGR